MGLPVSGSPALSDFFGVTSVVVLARLRTQNAGIRQSAVVAAAVIVTAAENRSLDGSRGRKSSAT